MSTAIDYTQWPLPANVTDRVAALGVTLASDIDAIQVQSRIDQITAEVERETRRNFVLTGSTTGTATGTSSTTLTDSTAAWTVNQWAGYAVSITAGVGINQMANIVSNTATTITIDQWTYSYNQYPTSYTSGSIPAAGDTYLINAIRYYNGSGTGELQIDEFVGLPKCTLFGYLGIPGGLSLSATVGTEMAGLPTSRLIIARGSLPAFAPIWIAVFPEGRSNIGVQAQFGYGVTIPKDLWQAVCDAAAQVLAEMEAYQIQGQIEKATELDTSVTYSLGMPEDLLNGRSRLKEAINRYTRPNYMRLRRMKRAMI